MYNLCPIFSFTVAVLNNLSDLHGHGVGGVLIKTLTDGETKLMFQCKAIHGSEYILSNVSKVSFKVSL